LDASHRLVFRVPSTRPLGRASWFRGCVVVCVAENASRVTEVRAAFPSAQRFELECSELVDDEIGEVCAIVEEGRMPLGALRLDWCRRLSDPALSRLVAPPPSPLREVVLLGCSGLQGRGVETLAAASPLLSHLDLGYCQGLDDGCLFALARHCPALEYLSMAYCALIGDDGVGALSACTRLTALDLACCSLVSDKAVVALGGALRDLRSVDLTACKLVTDLGAQALASGCPRLTSVRLTCSPCALG
jgi:hypothetical protein